MSYDYMLMKPRGEITIGEIGEDTLKPLGTVAEVRAMFDSHIRGLTWRENRIEASPGMSLPHGSPLRSLFGSVHADEFWLEVHLMGEDADSLLHATVQCSHRSQHEGELAAVAPLCRAEAWWVFDGQAMEWYPL